MATNVSHTSTARHGRARRSAFTLVETVVSVTVMSIVMLGLGSAIVIASKALPDPNRLTSRLIQESAIAADLLVDLQEARYIAERTAHAITFTVSDRDGDGSPERIRYAWSGTPGDPLTREYNTASAVTVLHDVYGFDLSYDTQETTEEYPGPLIESSNAILTQFVGPGDSDFVVTSQNWIGQCFDPKAFLPGLAVSWSFTAIEFVARSVNTTNGASDLRVRPATPDHEPSTESLKSIGLNENRLSGVSRWEEIAVNGGDLNDMPTDRELCFVVEWKKFDESAAIQYAAAGGSGRVATADAGTSWTSYASSSMLYKVWGTYKVLSPRQTVTRQYVTGVRFSLQAGDDSAARIDTAVRTLNTPEMLSAFWELNFDGDPRTVDTNGDATGDWENYSGPLDPDDLSDGIWHVPKFVGRRGISTVPDEDFAELTTVELRYRGTSVGGSGTYFRINADRHDGKSANLIVNLYKPTADSQEVWVGHELGSGTQEWLQTYDVPDDFVDVRLVIDPAEGTFAIFVDGSHKDTFVYWWGNTDPGAKAWLYTWNASAEIDYVSIRVGGNAP